MPALPIVCPFCPLHCDDVVVSEDGSVGIDCGRAAEGFAAAFGTAQARIGDSPGSLHQARRSAAALLRGRRSAEETAGDAADVAPAVTVVTAGTDLVSARQLESLRAAGRVEVTVDTTPVQRAMFDSVRRDGLLSATQGAVRRHADLVWSIGEFSALPRIWQRLIDPQRPAEQIAMPGGMTAERIAGISDAVRSGDGSLLAGPERRLYESLASSQYVAVVIGAGAWPPREATAAAVMLNRLVMHLAADRRAVIVSFDSAATNRAVAGWRTNRMLVAYQESRRGDTGTADARRPIAAGDETGGAEERVGATETAIAGSPAQILVRFGDSRESDAPPAEIQIGGRDPGAARAEIFLPAAVVGVHRAGAVIRGDGSVTLPLERITDSELPTPAEQLCELLPKD